MDNNDFINSSHILQQLETYECIIIELMKINRPNIILELKLSQIEKLICRVGSNLPTISQWNNKMSNWRNQYATSCQMFASAREKNHVHQKVC